MSTPSNAMPTSTKADAVATRQEAKPEAMTEYIPFAATDAVKLSVSIVKRLIAVKTRSGHTCSDDDAIKFIAMCKARRLNPFEGDAFLIGFDSKDGPKFSLITAHQAFLKRAELHAEYDGLRSGVVVSPGYECSACQGKRILIPPNGVPTKCIICNGVGLIDEVEGDIVPKDQELVGAWAVVHKKGKLPMCKRLPIAPFDKGYGQWESNRSGMIVKCVEADALRSAFPTTLGGLYLREEIDLFPQAPAQVGAPPPTFLSPISDEPTKGTGPTPTQRVIDRPIQDAPANEPEPAQEPSKPEMGSTPTPEAEKPSQSQPATETSPFQNIDPAGLAGDTLIAKVQETLEACGISGGQLTAWARKTPGMCKVDQSWSEMSETKLKAIISKWAGVGPVVKEVKV